MPCPYPSDGSWIAIAAMYGPSTARITATDAGLLVQHLLSSARERSGISGNLMGGMHIFLVLDRGLD